MTLIEELNGGGTKHVRRMVIGNNLVIAIPRLHGLREHAEIFVTVGIESSSNTGK